MRSPINTHIYLYRKNIYDEYEYAIFQRADNLEWWQGVCGGVEEGETLEQAALRESHEEAGTPLCMPIYRLDTISYLPVILFSEHVLWDDNIVVVPMYFYAIPYDGEVVLSSEHNEVRWLNYKDAENLVYFHDQKTALWELDKRLEIGKLKRS